MTVFNTSEYTQQMLTAGCAMAAEPDASAARVLEAIAGDVAASPVATDVAQRLALAAGVAVDHIAKWSGADRAEVLAETLKRICGGDDTP